jgi:hypothetical protein
LQLESCHRYHLWVLDTSAKKSGKPILSLFREETFVEKMKILKENTKMTPRYSLNLDNMM